MPSFLCLDRFTKNSGDSATIYQSPIEYRNSGNSILITPSAELD